MGWPLDVLDVLVLLELDAAVRQLGIVDLILAVEHRARASPVPVEASHVLEACHLLIRQVCDDLEHVAAVAVEAKDVVVDQVVLPDGVLEDKRGTNEAAEDPFGLHGIGVK